MANGIDPSIVGGSTTQIIDQSKMAKKANDALTQMDFLRLLTEQFKNQDMNNPTDNTEFIAQMAQFSALQSQVNMTQYMQNLYSSSMVGKTVVVATTTAGSNGLKTVEGVVTAVNITNGEFTYTVGGKQYNYANIMEIKETPNYHDYYNTVNSAVNLIGKTVVTAVAGEDGEIVNDTGVVTNVMFTANGYEFIMNGKTYSYGDIAEIKDPNAESGTKPPEEEGEGGDGGESGDGGSEETGGAETV